MAYDPGAMEAALAAVVGDDSPLLDELRAAFFESAGAHRSMLQRATTPTDWCYAATRLQSLAASFGALRLIDAACSAGTMPVGDARALTRVDRAIAALRGDAGA